MQKTALLWPREFFKLAFADTQKYVPRKDMAKVLEPGDILLMSMDSSANDPTEGLLGKLVATYRKVAPTLQGDMGHSAMYVGDGKLVESRAGEGVTLKDIYSASKNKDVLAIRPRASEDDRSRAAAFAISQVGKGYDNKALAFTSLGVMVPTEVTQLLGKMFNKEERISGAIDKWTCSNLIAAAYPNTDLDAAGITMAAPSAFRKSKDIDPLFRTRPREALLRPTWGRLSDD